MMLQYPFFRLALIGVLIISIAAAVIGTYIISRRLVAISGGITHACFGGLGLGYFLGINPIVMAGVFAVASSLGVEWMSSRFRIREDSAIAVVWALGMAIGVLFVFLTPGYVPELNSFLFGNILTVTAADIWAFGVYTVVLLTFFAVYYKEIVACAFDRDFARVSGLPVRFITISMTVLTALCIVLTIRLVGVMLLMSMLSLPMMIAEVWVHRFGQLMRFSVVVSAVCCVGGLFVSVVVDVPASALIVLIMSGAFIVSRAAGTLRRAR
ncbi:MAG: metal ABC transporter permease [Bacteroidales bacterium]|nr:metal ABC transporter permease [Bacteroidales bacterium]